jgi:alpha-amylase
MPALTLTFKVHQPFRIAKVHLNGSIGNDIFQDYFDHGLNKFVLDKVSKNCYYAANATLLDLLDKFKSERRKFKIAFSFSGVFFELVENFNFRDLFESFLQLGRHKNVEILGETYYHSLASLFPEKDEFIEQVNLHRQRMKELFGKEPKVFLNTEMIYNNVIGKIVEELGFKGIFTEGHERILGWRSPNYIYVRKYCFPNDPEPKHRIKILLRNYRLSDDVGWRFSCKNWEEWPLTADKYAAWLNATPGQVINLAMDYETFGDHHWQDTGILLFLRYLPEEVLKYESLEFMFPSEVIEKFEPVGEIDVFEFSTVSWADMERDVSAWLGNSMQQLLFKEIQEIGKLVKKLNNPFYTKIWRLLQISDNLYYCCTKWWNDGDVHKYFSVFDTPYDCFANFMAILYDFKLRLMQELNCTK